MQDYRGGPKLITWVLKSRRWGAGESGGVMTGAEVRVNESLISAVADGMGHH